MDLTDGGGNSGTINNDGTYHAFGINSGTINNSGLMTYGFGANNGTINNTGTFKNEGTLGNFPLDNEGTFLNSGKLTNVFGAVLTSGGLILNSGTFNNDGTFSNSGTFTNSSTVRISDSGLFTTSTDYTQTAGRTVVNGTLTATSGAIVDIQGGSLRGTGTINGDVLMNALMSPGSGGAPGTFTINGNYEQTSTGVFDELISGKSSNGLLDVTGVLALDPGSLLKITLQGGFDPLGDSFTILDFGSLSGQFANGSTFFADGFEWTLVYGTNDVVLTAVSDPPSTIPEPNAMPLFALGLLALLTYAARKTPAPGR
jgi:subtilase-type serine protease